MAGWMSTNPKLTPKAVDGNEMFMCLTPLHQKSAGLDLIQNCDLPPPMKVFTRSDNKTFQASMSRIRSMNSIVEDEYRDGLDRGDGENEKLELLKALRRSQTRAREAEKKAEKMAKEKARLSNAFLGEANVLFAYRQWVRLLELQVSKLQSQLGGQGNQARCYCGRSKGAMHFSEGGDDGKNGDEITWIVALALFFGIAGVGLAFGYSYLY